MPVANCRPLVFEDMKVLAVERFDRVWWQPDGGARWLVRLPQEDLCQATATPPHLKYEADGGPGMARILEVLSGSVDPRQDRRVFFQAQILFWMLCPTDGHAKNFSLFLRPGGAYASTPLYDVLSAYPILGEGPDRLSPHRARMAMAVRGRDAHHRMRDIRRQHWQAMGERHGILTPDGGAASRVIDDLVERTSDVVRTVRDALPADFPQALAGSILGGLVDAARRLAQ